MKRRQRGKGELQKKSSNMILHAGQSFKTYNKFA